MNSTSLFSRCRMGFGFFTQQFSQNLVTQEVFVWLTSNFQDWIGHLCKVWLLNTKHEKNSVLCTNLLKPIFLDKCIANNMHQQQSDTLLRVWLLDWKIITLSWMKSNLHSCKFWLQNIYKIKVMVLYGTAQPCWTG